MKNTAIIIALVVTTALLSGGVMLAMASKSNPPPQDTRSFKNGILHSDNTPGDEHGDFVLVNVISKRQFTAHITRAGDWLYIWTTHKSQGITLSLSANDISTDSDPPKEKSPPSKNSA